MSAQKHKPDRWEVVGISDGAVCHFEVTRDHKRMLWLHRNEVVFADGSRMWFAVHWLAPHAKVHPVALGPEASGYGSLIDDLIRFKTNDVRELTRLQKAAEKRGETVPEDNDR